jgi:hypothetical protein
MEVVPDYPEIRKKEIQGSASSINASGKEAGGERWTAKFTVY